MKGPVTVVVEDRPLAETKVVEDLLHVCERIIPHISSIVEFVLPFIRVDLHALQTPNFELALMHS